MKRHLFLWHSPMPLSAAGTPAEVAAVTYPTYTEGISIYGTTPATQSVYGRVR